MRRVLRRVAMNRLWRRNRWMRQRVGISDWFARWFRFTGRFACSRLGKIMLRLVEIKRLWLLIVIGLRFVVLSPSKTSISIFRFFVFDVFLEESCHIFICQQDSLLVFDFLSLGYDIVVFVGGNTHAAGTNRSSDESANHPSAEFHYVRKSLNKLSLLRMILTLKDQPAYCNSTVDGTIYLVSIKLLIFF